MAEEKLTVAAAARGMGMGFFAGGLFVLAAMAIERTLIRDHSSRK